MALASAVKICNRIYKYMYSAVTVHTGYVPAGSPRGINRLGAYPEKIAPMLGIKRFLLQIFVYLQ